MWGSSWGYGGSGYGNSSYSYGGGGTTYSYESGAKRDTKKYKQGYPDDELDDPKKDWNWAFFSNKIKSQGHEGAKVEDVLKDWWGDYDKLESKHDYIQWLFPIHEKSGFNYDSQALQRHEVRKIRASKVATGNFLKCYELILDFFGFVIANHATGRLARKKTGALDRLDNLNTHSHNYLRITRILKCLGEMGFEHYKLPFLKAMAMEIYEHKTLTNALSGFEDYWMNTLVDPRDEHELDRFLAPLLAKKKREDEKKKRRYDDWSDTCDFKAGERVAVKFNGEWCPGDFVKYDYYAGYKREYAVQCDCDKKGVLTHCSRSLIKSLKKDDEEEKDDEAKKSEEEAEKPLEIEIPDVPWCDEAEAMRVRSQMQILRKYSMRDDVFEKQTASSRRRCKNLPSILWKKIFEEYLEVWFLKSRAWLEFVDVRTTLTAKPSLTWSVDGSDGALAAGASFLLTFRAPGVDTDNGFVGLYQVDQPDEVIETRIVPIKQSKSATYTLSFDQKLGPWDVSKMYEFRYFASGWDAAKDALLFVPSRGPDAKSAPFKISGVASDAAAANRAPIAKKPPADADLASNNLDRRSTYSSYSYGGSSTYSYNDYDESDAKEKEKEAGFVRGETRVKVLYKGQWYNGTFEKYNIRRANNYKYMKTPWQVQCDEDPKGTLTSARLDDIQKIGGGDGGKTDNDDDIVATPIEVDSPANRSDELNPL